MKALEKDRTRRYETANGFASDIQRHLNNEPVVACPPSNLYRFQKMVRRNKVAFTAGAAVSAALLIGLGVSTWMFFRERDAKKEQVRLRQVAQASETKARSNELKAKAEAAKSEASARFLQDMLAGVGPEVAKGRDATILKEVLDKTVEHVGRALANQPATEAHVLATASEVYLAIGDYPTAEAVERRVVASERQFHPGGSRDLAAALISPPRSCFEEACLKPKP